MKPQRVLWLLPALLALPFWLLRRTAYFVADDFIFLQYAQSRRGASLLSELSRLCVVDGTYRPLGTHLYWRLMEHLFGLQPLPYQLVAWVLLVANAYLLATMVWRLLGRHGPALVVGVLWVTRGALMGNVYWWSTAPDNLMTFFGLITVLLFLAARRQGRSLRAARMLELLALVSFLLANLAKEVAAVLPILLAGVLWAVSHRERREGLRLIPYVILAAAGLLIRWRFCILRPEYGIGSMSPEILRKLGHGVLTLLWGDAAGREGWGSWLCMALLAMTIVWLMVRSAGSRSARLALSGLIFFAFALLPPVLLVHRLEHHYLPLPMVGLALAIAVGADRLLRASRRVGLLILSGLLCTSYMVESRAVDTQLEGGVEIGLLDSLRWQEPIHELAGKARWLQESAEPIQHLYLLGFPFDAWVSVLDENGQLKPTSTLQAFFRVLLRNPRLVVFRVGPEARPGILAVQELPQRLAADDRPKAVLQYP